MRKYKLHKADECQYRWPVCFICSVENSLELLTPSSIEELKKKIWMTSIYFVSIITINETN